MHALGSGQLSAADTASSRLTDTSHISVYPPNESIDSLLNEPYDHGMEYTHVDATALADASIDRELAAYMDEQLHIPKQMSLMAKMMYM